MERTAMEQESETNRVWTKVIGAAALGAAAMYVFDPDKGRRRRALARDKVRSLGDKTTDLVEAAKRDVTFRWQGLQAQARRLVRRDEAADDAVLEARVRAKLGRVVSHPHPITVAAHQGCVTLSGPILRGEEQELLHAVRAVAGVYEIDNKLDVHEASENFSSLQGGRTIPRVRIEPLQDNWTPALRLAAIVGGSAASVYGLKHRGFTGWVLATIGIGLAARGAANAPIKQLAGAVGGRQVFNLQKGIQIDASPETVFDLWTNYENFPRFMSHVEEIRDLGNGRSHWVMGGPSDSRFEWDAVITQSVRPSLLAWSAEAGSEVRHAGYVCFEPANGGTWVTVKMAFNAGGAIGHRLATLLGSDPMRQLEDDLMRMKRFIETAVPPHDSAKPDTTAGQVFH